MDPERYEFWSREEETLWEEVEPLIILALLAGSTEGANMIPSELVALIDWEFFNKLAQDLTFDYRSSTLANINKTTLNAVISLISSWDFMNRPVSELIDEMEKFLKNEARIESISITEVTRLLSWGSVLVWAATGSVFMKEWVTAADERVCPICAPLHGVRVPLWANFSIGIPNPPAHPRCRCSVRPLI